MLLDLLVPKTNIAFHISVLVKHNFEIFNQIDYVFLSSFLSLLPTHHYVSQVTHHCHHIAIKHGSQQFSDWQQMVSK